ncbi:MAG: response regulator [Verrucomicrobiales bacterium]
MNQDEVEILLVEDNPDDLELALLALKRNNVANKIHVARDGEEALDFLLCRGKHSSRPADAQPKVVLLDLKLPKVDGLEVLREVKGNEFTKSVPIVVMTSSKEQRDMVEGYKLGVNSYIQKPVDFNQFRDIINKLGFYWLVINQSPPKDAFARG